MSQNCKVRKTYTKNNLLIIDNSKSYKTKDLTYSNFLLGKIPLYNLLHK